MEVLELHKNWQHIDQCCMLLNSEWPRSMSARRRNLEASCDSFPTNLILIQKDHVIGHSKISAIPSDPSACFFESVIIHSDLRGRGLGKILMVLTENYVKKKNVCTAYLSTIDKESFYSKLGYTVCEPISIYGCSYSNVTESIETNQSLESKGHHPSVSSTVPPPPPLPRWELNNHLKAKPLVTLSSRKVFMSKAI